VPVVAFPSFAERRARGMPDFDAGFRREFERLLRWRRDVRRFRTDPLPAGCLDRLLDLACLAPSVGNAQPWRFVTVDEPERRRAVTAVFERCNAEALAAQPDERRALYARLKLAGLREAPVHLAVFCDGGTAQGNGLGRATMPATLEWSAVLAVHTLWLAARAEGVALGWVSILDPDEVARLLDVPADWRLVAYLCLGYPTEDSDRPELERVGWQARTAASRVVLHR